MLVIVERLLDVAIDIEFLKEVYFTFDKPVPYRVDKEHILEIKPVLMKDFMIFNMSSRVLTVDKNSSSCVEHIQMSYLQYIFDVLLKQEGMVDAFVNILLLCLDFRKPSIKEVNGRNVLYDEEKGITITPKKFDDIKKIILYQNFLHYDDEYINPDLKKAMADVDRLKNKDLDPPSTERKMAIISSHCGITKQEQMEMTMRSHSSLFEEVCGEIEFNASYPIYLYAGKGDKLNYIYRKKKNKFDGYISSVQDFSRSMGGDGSVKQATSSSSNLEKQYNSFNK